MSIYQYPSSKTRKIELLAPAGNREKLEMAIHYGADAVYLAGKNFSLRNFSDNFSIDEMTEAVTFSHDNGVKVYVACNIYSRNHEQEAITAFLRDLEKVKPDGLIVADPAVFRLARRFVPKIPLHISTQANVTNYNAALFWQELGAKRLIVARELTLSEIREIVQSSRLEIEAFVHGAMCISYSGRCLLSNAMANRESNRGKCCHPCRFKYLIMEETRPGQYFPISQDDRGTYIFNSKDLCMLEHLPQMANAGITSLKIEGRMKSIHYLATTVKIYREALDAYIADPKRFMVQSDWINELSKVSHRGYCSGFYLNDPDQARPNLYDLRCTGTTFAGKIFALNKNGKVGVEVRNRLKPGDKVELLPCKGPVRKGQITSITDMDGNILNAAQPVNQVMLELDLACDTMDILRRIDPTS
jgi:putative protease